MTLAKVSSGQPLRMTADTFNAFIDAAAAHQAQQRSRFGDGGSTMPIAGIVTVRNDAGADQDRFAVLGIGMPLILPSENAAAFQERVALALIAPDEEVHADRLCILQEPIAAGALGRGLILGVTPVRLDVQAEDDRSATIVTGETGTLRTGSSGAARILWKEAGTGERWGIVQIPSGGSGGGSPNLVLEVASANHPWMVGDILRWNGSAWVPADAGVVGDTDTLAVVGRIPDADTALLVLWGVFCLDGLAPHTDYWLDPSTPGLLTPTKPTAAPRLILHHAEGGLCVLRAGAAGGGGSASRFADLTDVDVTTTPPTDEQAALWDGAAERWKPRDVVVADPVPAHQVLAGPAAGADAKPDFRDLAAADLAAQPATSVIANATNAAARPTAFAATVDDRALLRVGGTLQWLQIPGAVLADGAVSDAKVTDVAWSKITNPPETATRWPTWNEITGLPIEFPPAAHLHTLGGDLSGTTADAQIIPDAVGTLELATGAVTTAKIGAGQVVEAHLVNGAVTTPKLADAAVTTAKIASATDTATGVTNAKLRHGAAASVMGRAAATVGPIADLVATADDSALVRVAGTLQWLTTIPRLRFGGSATGWVRFINSGGVASHEYDALNTVQAWKQWSNGRTRWYWTATDYWEVAANGTSIEITAWTGGVAGHSIALQASTVLGGAPRRLALREFDFCVSGQARKIAVLASDPY